MLSERTNATGPRFQKHLRHLQTPSAQRCALIFRTALGASPFHCTKLCKLRTLKILISWVAIILTDRNEQVMQVLASTIAFGHSWGFTSFASKCEPGDREVFSKNNYFAAQISWANMSQGNPGAEVSNSLSACTVRIPTGTVPPLMKSMYILYINVWRDISQR